jgi:hypothetical protein
MLPLRHLARLHAARQGMLEHRHATHVDRVPLLVLALTGSAVKAGFALFARTLPRRSHSGRGRGPDR